MIRFMPWWLRRIYWRWHIRRAIRRRAREGRMPTMTADALMKLMRGGED